MESAGITLLKGDLDGIVRAGDHIDWQRVLTS